VTRQATRACYYNYSVLLIAKAYLLQAFISVDKRGGVMSTYEYECLSCGYRFEEFQQMTYALLEQCPECQGKIKRLIGAAAGLSLKKAVFTLLITGVNCLQRRQGKSLLKSPHSVDRSPLAPIRRNLLENEKASKSPIGRYKRRMRRCAEQMN